MMGLVYGMAMQLKTCLGGGEVLDSKKMDTIPKCHACGWSKRKLNEQIKSVTPFWVISNALPSPWGFIKQIWRFDQGHRAKQTEHSGIKWKGYMMKRMGKNAEEAKQRNGINLFQYAYSFSYCWNMFFLCCSQDNQKIKLGFPDDTFVLRKKVCVHVEVSIEHLLQQGLKLASNASSSLHCENTQPRPGDLDGESMAQVEGCVEGTGTWKAACTQLHALSQRIHLRPTIFINTSLRKRCLARKHADEVLGLILQIAWDVQEQLQVLRGSVFQDSGSKPPGQRTCSPGPCPPAAQTGKDTLEYKTVQDAETGISQKICRPKPQWVEKENSYF